MPNTKSAEKRVRVEARRRMRNRAIIGATRTAVKKFERSLGVLERPQVEALFKEALRKLDKAASKGVIHRNAAARKKSRLARRFNQYVNQASAEAAQA